LIKGGDCALGLSLLPPNLSSIRKIDSLLKHHLKELTVEVGMSLTQHVQNQKRWKVCEKAEVDALLKILQSPVDSINQSISTLKLQSRKRKLFKDTNFIE